MKKVIQVSHTIAALIIFSVMVFFPVIYTSDSEALNTVAEDTITAIYSNSAPKQEERE